jgi:hypothetical protein
MLSSIPLEAIALLLSFLLHLPKLIGLYELAANVTLRPVSDAKTGNNLLRQHPC